MKILDSAYQTHYRTENLTDEELLVKMKYFIDRSDHFEGFIRLYKEVYKLASIFDSDFPFIEVGNRIGGSAMLIMWAIKNSGRRRPFYTVDCHGTMPIDEIEKYYMDFMFNVSNYAFEEKINWIHFRMKSVDFIKIYELMDFYKDFKRFAFVYLDGNHNPNTVEEELAYFIPRIVKGGLLVVDDVRINLDWADYNLKNYYDFTKKCQWYDGMNIAYLQL